MKIPDDVMTEAAAMIWGSTGDCVDAKDARAALDAALHIIKPAIEATLLQEIHAVKPYDWGDPEKDRYEAMVSEEMAMADRHLAEFRLFKQRNPGAGEFYLNIVNHETGGELQGHPTYERQVKEQTIRELIRRIDDIRNHVGSEEWSEARGYLVAQIAKYMEDADFEAEYVKVLQP